MILERWPILFLLLNLTLFVPGSVAAQTNEPKREPGPVKAGKDNSVAVVDAAAGGKNQATINEAPVVNSYWPHSGSVNSVIKLSGFRLGVDDPEPAKAFVIQNGIEIPARAGGGSSVTNDSMNGPRTLEVILPEEVVPGPAQIVAERNGFRSAPVTITITEWTVPLIRRITPASGPPGTVVSIDCENFHIYDEIELTDAAGRRVNSFKSGGSSNGTGFIVPKDFPEGVLRIRIGQRKPGKDQFTPPVEFEVTNNALPPELLTEWIKSVAPGQWIDLQVSSAASLENSEETEVSFKQDGREIIQHMPHPRRARVEVPPALSPGGVQVQVRTWRNARPSNWSTPVVLQLVEQPVPPYVQALRLENDTWVQLWPGPDRATHFAAHPGDLIVMNGTYPVAGPNELKVLFARSGEVVELQVTELNEKADGFNDVSMKIPANMDTGNWQMIVRAIDGSEHVVPIPIRILPK